MFERILLFCIVGFLLSVLNSCTNKREIVITGYTIMYPIGGDTVKNEWSYAADTCYLLVDDKDDTTYIFQKKVELGTRNKLTGTESFLWRSKKGDVGYFYYSDTSQPKNASIDSVRRQYFAKVADAYEPSSEDYTKTVFNDSNGFRIEKYVVRDTSISWDDTIVLKYKIPRTKMAVSMSKALDSLRNANLTELRVMELSTGPRSNSGIRSILIEKAGLFDLSKEAKDSIYTRVSKLRGWKSLLAKGHL